MNITAPNPTGKGGFHKGQSGNPGGRPRGARRMIETLAVAAREYSDLSLKTLAKLLKDPDPRVRLAASCALLDRGYGRPAQSVELQVSGSITQLDLFAGLEPAEQRQIRDAIRSIEDQSAKNDLGEPMDPIDVEILDTAVEVGMLDTDEAAEAP